MADKLWLNLLHFTSHRGLESLWYEKPREYVKNETQKRVLVSTFPNFVVGSLTQGGIGLEGLHGPFPVKGLEGLSALVHLFYLVGKSNKDKKVAFSRDKTENLFILVIYQESIMDGLLSPDVLARIESIVVQWAQSEVKTKDRLNRKHFKSLKKQLDELYEEIEESGKIALQEEIARKTLANVLVQANVLLAQKNQTIRVFLHYGKDLLTDLVPLIYASLVKDNQHRGIKITFDPQKDEGYLDFGNLVLKTHGNLDMKSPFSFLHKANMLDQKILHLIFLDIDQVKKVKSLVTNYVNLGLPQDLHENVYLFAAFKKESDLRKCRDMFIERLGEVIPRIIPLSMVSSAGTRQLEVFQVIADNLIEIIVSVGN